MRVNIKEILSFSESCFSGKCKYFPIKRFRDQFGEQVSYWDKTKKSPVNIQVEYLDEDDIKRMRPKDKEYAREIIKNRRSS